MSLTLANQFGEFTRGHADSLLAAIRVGHEAIEFFHLEVTQFTVVTCSQQQASNLVVEFTVFFLSHTFGTWNLHVNALRDLDPSSWTYFINRIPHFIMLFFSILKTLDLLGIYIWVDLSASEVSLAASIHKRKCVLLASDV